jgi:thiamine-monophosphate kinase
MSQTLSDIGEFGLIDRIHELLGKEGLKTPGVTLGIGDDTASFRPREGYEMLVTCDSMVEGRHYLPEHITPLDVGRRAMALNVSDVGAMGGRPLYALVSLGLKSETLVADVEAIYRGFIAELNPFGASVIGGNVTKTEHAMFIDITLIGEVEKDKMVRRSGARAGDAILVTGYPGESAAGLHLLLNAQPLGDLSKHPLVQAYNTPSHRAREGEAIGRSGYATAMIDTSDGFLGDLGHICEESRVGAALILEKLPMRKDLKEAAAQLGKDPFELALQESDDYELIITCAVENMDGICSALDAVSDVLVTEVGQITEVGDGIKLIMPDGAERRVTPSGWDHFNE